MEVVSNDLIYWPELKLEDFIQQKDCPFCGSSFCKLVKGYGKNIIGGRKFPAGAFRFSDELRRARQLRRCQNCKLIYQEWIPSQELLLDLYATTKERQPWPPDPYRQTWRRAMSYLPKQPGRLLDVGANDGHFLSLLPSGWEGAALEPTGAAYPALQMTAREIYRGFIDDSSLDLPKDSFDVVCLFDVAEHLKDVKTAMSNIAYCLKPGGIAILETGNTACLPAQIQKSMWWYYDYIEHFVFFNSGSLKKALNSVNLEMHKCLNVVHTSRGGSRTMLKDLLKKRVAPFNRKHGLGVGQDQGNICLENPLRIYWPDHLFAVAYKKQLND